jgi:NADH-quinone oxidoreductase subunit C
MLGADLPRKLDPANKSVPARAGDAFVLVEAAKLPEFLRICRDDPRLRFEMLVDITATDPSKTSDDLWINVSLLSVSLRQRLQIKAVLKKSSARLPSVCAIYPAANWHERECAEMFGIVFEGHPDPRHILLPDDWVGHPLRKDYEYPVSYHGISCE